ncbi:hypothetical protein [Streptomyces sp. C10-9-1]|uniref:hypothetical protein n=1 Tax=Streptomyces sp. C10-9-1 TaxID=1859285 RepID=UPI003D75705C
MARIQVLELPTIYPGDRDPETPFVLIIDDVTEEQVKYLQHQVEGLAEKCGARTAIYSTIPLDVPAS